MPRIWWLWLRTRRRREARRKSLKFLYFDIFYVDLDCTRVYQGTQQGFLLLSFRSLSNFSWICLLFHITLRFQPHDIFTSHHTIPPLMCASIIFREPCRTRSSSSNIYCALSCKKCSSNHSRIKRKYTFNLSFHIRTEKRNKNLRVCGQQQRISRIHDFLSKQKSFVNTLRYMQVSLCEIHMKFDMHFCAEQEKNENKFALSVGTLIHEAEKNLYPGIKFHHSFGKTARNSHECASRFEFLVALIFLFVRQLTLCVRIVFWVFGFFDF